VNALERTASSAQEGTNRCIVIIEEEAELRLLDND